MHQKFLHKDGNIGMRPMYFLLVLSVLAADCKKNFTRQSFAKVLDPFCAQRWSKTSELFAN
jgi:hypothetical protein